MSPGTSRSLMYELNVQALMLRHALTAIQSISLVPEAHTLPLKLFSHRERLYWSQTLLSFLFSVCACVCFWLVYVAVCDWDVMKGCVFEGIPPCGDGDSALSCLCSACDMKEANDWIYITSCEKFSVCIPQVVWDINHRCPFHLISICVWMYTHLCVFVVCEVLPVVNTVSMPDHVNLIKAAAIRAKRKFSYWDTLRCSKGEL